MHSLRHLLVPALLAATLLVPASAAAIDVAVYGAPNASSWNNDVVSKRS